VRRGLRPFIGGRDRLRDGHRTGGSVTLKTEISEMIRNSDINDPHNTEMHRGVCIIVDILNQFPISERLA
jgi:hypothetical protein